MELQLFLPDGFAHHAASWVAADPAMTGIALVEGTEEGDEDESSTASTIAGLLPLLLIVVAVYFLLLRPRQRQMRQQRELQSSLEVGDEVLLTSGVYAFITAFDPGTDIVWVEIDDDVQIRVSRAAISGKVLAPGAATPAADGAETSAEPAPSAPRRPTLKGGGTKPATSTPPAPAPKPAGEPTTDEPAAE